MPSKTMPTVQPFGRRNFRIFIVALGILTLGYTLLAIPPVDGFFSRTAAPLLLVLGYCVLVPWALLTPAGLSPTVAQTPQIVPEVKKRRRTHSSLKPISFNSAKPTDAYRGLPTLEACSWTQCTPCSWA